MATTEVKSSGAEAVAVVFDSGGREAEHFVQDARGGCGRRDFERDAVKATDRVLLGHAAVRPSRDVARVFHRNDFELVAVGIVEGEHVLTEARGRVLERNSLFGESLAPER
jgi:hypothetical protein